MIDNNTTNKDERVGKMDENYFNNYKQWIGRETKHCFFTIFLLLFSVPALWAQDSQSLEFGEDSIPSTNTGPSTTAEIRFIYNLNNPSDNVFTEYLPELTATITFDNQQHFVSQDTNNNNSGEKDGGGFGGDENPPVVFGWNYGGSGPNPDGESRDILVSMDSDPVSFDLSDSEVGSIEGYERFFSSLQSIVGDGIDFETNYGTFIEAGFEGLGIDEVNYEGTRERLADMTITFSEPVTDPVLHFFGLGGRWGFTDNELGLAYFNTASVEFTLINSSADGAVSLSLLSSTHSDSSSNSSEGLRVSGNDIINTYNIPDVIDKEGHMDEDRGVANGSVLVSGDNITSLEFEVYARAISDTDQAQDEVQNDLDPSNELIIGDEEFGWDGHDFFGPFDPLDSYNFASDLFRFSISTQVLPDETLLTGEDCYRMLSAPVEGATYGDLVRDFWIQGQNITGNGVDYTDGNAAPNVFVWPTPQITGSGSYGEGWQELSNLDDPIEPGTGFLISVFEDDDIETDGTQNPFDKTISVTGSENTPPTVSGGNGLMNSGADDFSLLGNPFKSTIDWNNIHPGNTLDVRDAVYIWDRSIPGYVSYVGGVEGAGGFGDLTGGLIEPFQGFLVQNEATIDEGGPEVDFTGAKAAMDGSGSFYGKNNTKKNFVRLEVNGKSLFNSMWVWFSDQGSLERTTGDALELTSLAYDYAMFGTRKNNGTIFDIGHYPIPDEEFEIPVSLQTTRSGTFTITATDTDISFGYDLYFIDLQENESIRIDENLNYQFTLEGEGVAAKETGANFRKCTVGTPQKAKTVASADRFMIATSPKQFNSEMPASIALNQNYPNPFNPTTQISYELPQQSDVRLEVYDLVGRQVATLVNETMEAGVHTVNFNATHLSSGVYIYRLNAGNILLSRKLTVLK